MAQDEGVLAPLMLAVFASLIFVVLAPLMFAEELESFEPELPWVARLAWPGGVNVSLRLEEVGEALLFDVVLTPPSPLRSEPGLDVGFSRVTPPIPVGEEFEGVLAPLMFADDVLDPLMLADELDLLDSINREKLAWEGSPRPTVMRLVLCPTNLVMKVALTLSSMTDIRFVEVLTPIIEFCAFIVFLPSRVLPVDPFAQVAAPASTVEPLSHVALFTT